MNKTAKIIISVIILVVVFWSATMFFKGRETAPNGETTGDGSTSAAERIKIGFMGPLSGDAATYGESIKRGVELAQKALLLENVKITYEDSKCEAKEAANVVNKLVSVDKVVAIIGEACSSATLAAAPVAEENKVVLISPASTSPELTTAGEYVFRVIPSDALQGSFAAKLVYDRGYKKLAILYINDDYGKGFDGVLKESFTGLGGEVVASETFERNVADVRTQVTKIKETGSDAIFIISNSPSSAVAALKQIKEFGIEAAIFGSEGLKGPDILEGAKEAAEGLRITSVSSGTSDFVAQHVAEYGSDPGPFAAQGYDALTALAMALEAGAKTGEEIKSALAEVAFDGASGAVRFDANGDVSGNYDVFVVKDGAFVREEDTLTEKKDASAEVETEEEATGTVGVEDAGE